MLISEILHHLEVLAPVGRQDSYDNSGLQVGQTNVECTGALVCVDVTPSVVNEAIEVGCNLIISHHPVLFKPLKRIVGNTIPEQCVMMALSAGVTIYSAHTCLDNAPGSVSWKMAQMLGLTDIRVLRPIQGTVEKLSFVVPAEFREHVSQAVFKAGAGDMSGCTDCSSYYHGTGTWRLPDDDSHYINQDVVKVDIFFPSWRRGAVEEALLRSHPYQAPVYEFVTPDNGEPDAGAGAIGILPDPLTSTQLVYKIKDTFGSPIARCSAFGGDTMVQRVALCGGSGSFLIPDAIAAKADVFLTADTRYHDFVDYGPQILLVDIGHYESEMCTKSIFYHLIREIFPNFAVRYSQQDTNPIKYL